MLHQRDVRCEELTHELMQLLEERDTLQLRLSNAIRVNEELRKYKLAGPISSPISSPKRNLSPTEAMSGHARSLLQDSSSSDAEGPIEIAREAINSSIGEDKKALALKYAPTHVTLFHYLFSLPFILKPPSQASFTRQETLTAFITRSSHSNALLSRLMRTNDAMTFLPTRQPNNTYPRSPSIDCRLLTVERSLSRPVACLFALKRRNIDKVDVSKVFRPGSEANGQLSF
jgi:hypothetical protein